MDNCFIAAVVLLLKDKVLLFPAPYGFNVGHWVKFYVYVRMQYSY